MVPDPNSYLGEANGITFVLVVAITLLLGSMIVAYCSHRTGASIVASLIILLVYIGYGVASYLLLGPFTFNPDAATYDAQAVTVASDFGLGLPRGFETPLHSGKEGFPQLLGFIYAFLGRAPIAGIMLNALVSALVAVTLMATIRAAFNRNGSWLVLIYFLIVPTLLTLGPSLLREALCWFGVALWCRAIVGVMRERTYLTSSILGLLGLALLLWVRTSLGYLVVIATVGGIALAALWRAFGGTGVLLSAGGLVLSMLYLGDPILSSLGFTESFIINAREWNTETAITGYQAVLQPLESFGIPGYMIATIPNLVLGPFPWEVGTDMVWIWVLISSIMWWWCLIVVFVRARKYGVDRLWLVLVGMALIVLLGLGTVLTSYGALIRLRTVPLIILIILMSYTKQTTAEWSANRRNKHIVQNSFGTKIGYAHNHGTPVADFSRGAGSIHKESRV